MKPQNDRPNQQQTGNCTPPAKHKKTLIINHLPQTPSATTGKKPAKPEMKNKQYMIQETTKRQTIAATNRQWHITSKNTKTH